MKPTLRDVLLLLGLQLGTAAAALVILALLPIPTGSNSWIGGVAVLIGGQSFPFIKERKSPGSVATPGFAHRLALAASLGQLMLAAAFAGVVALVAPDDAARIAAQMGWWLAVVVAVSVPLCYGLTRWGLALGLRNLTRAKAIAAKKSSPPASKPPGG
jgi:hypothetical protein